MPDLKTELSKVIDQWNKPEEPATTQPTPALPSSLSVTNNVCRATYDFIHQNPGKTRKEIIDALTLSGYKPGSTTSLIGQMLKQEHIRESQGLLYANYTEYRPLKSNAVFMRMQEAVGRTKAVAVKRPKVKATEAPAATPDSVQINSAWDADTLLNNLSIKQARALYDELRKIFGG